MTEAAEQTKGSPALGGLLASTSLEKEAAKEVAAVEDTLPGQLQSGQGDQQAQGQQQQQQGLAQQANWPAQQQGLSQQGAPASAAAAAAATTAPVAAAGVTQRSLPRRPGYAPWDLPLAGSCLGDVCRGSHCDPP